MVEIDEIVVEVDACAAQEELEQIDSVLEQFRESGTVPTERIVAKRLTTRKEELTGLVLSRKYPILSPRFMTAANNVAKKGDDWIMPRFIPFNWTEPCFEVVMSGKENVTYEERHDCIKLDNNIPFILCEPLLKVLQQNFKRQKGWQRISKHGDIQNEWHCRPSCFGGQWATKFSAELATIVPAEAKERLEQAEKDRTFKSIHCIAEVEPSDWIATEMPIRKADPLIVGVLGGRVHLIAKFDPTPLENYVSKEFLK